jgi:hypothetical protein
VREVFFFCTTKARSLVEIWGVAAQVEQIDDLLLHEDLIHQTVIAR